MSLTIEPAAGMVAVEFLDDATEEADESYPSATPADIGDYNEAVFAMCLGPSKTYDGKATGYKRGDTLIVRKSARDNAIDVGDGGCLVSTYDILGKVKA